MFDDSKKQADNRLKSILSSIEKKDTESLKNLFSLQALNETIDFDDQVIYLLNLFQGNVISWKRDGSNGHTDISDGKKLVRLISWYKVTTDTNIYIFFIIDYPQDTINTDNAGLYTLRVVKIEDEEAYLTGKWTDMEIPGIFKPEL